MKQIVNYPLVFQESWLKDFVIECIGHHIYTSSLYIKKGFTKKDVKVMPILRIFKFLNSTSSLGITAILADSKHKILAYFPFRPTIVKFETFYKQRLTFHTANCLITVQQANLKFINKTELHNDYCVDFSNDIDIAILEIIDFKIFQRDQVLLHNSIENSLSFLYDDGDYKSLCRRTTGGLFLSSSAMAEDDDVVSS